ncbi:MAG: efflux RND transporter periplasmic adaptor subunit [Myxococcales bacterium]|nr:efflux RND transporter periplasmic adaptor subunit [Myxococcales bacterium]
MSDELTRDLASLKIDRATRPEGGRLVRTLVIVALVGGTLVAAWLVGWPWLEALLYKTTVETGLIHTVSPAQGSVDLTSTGYVVPQVTARVTGKLAGRLAEVRVREGELVAAGAVIALLDDTDQRAAVRAAQTRVLAARARAQTVRAQVAEVEQQRRREAALVGQGVTARAVVEDLDARARALTAQVAAADAEARAAQAEVESLRVSLGHMTVVAPITGTVIERALEPGELVVPPALIVELADLGTLAVESDVPEARVGLVRLGRPAEITLDAYPGERLRGEVSEIAPRVDRAKATITVKVKLTDTPEKMAKVKPDMSARVNFLARELTAAEATAQPKVIVPLTAVVARAGANVVFVVEAGKAHSVAVKVGEPFADGLELLEGPPSGAKVVIAPGSLRDRQSIKEKNAD